jgi:hypothetical protein
MSIPERRLQFADNFISDLSIEVAKIRVGSAEALVWIADHIDALRYHEPPESPEPDEVIESREVCDDKTDAVTDAVPDAVSDLSSDGDAKTCPW